MSKRAWLPPAILALCAASMVAASCRPEGTQTRVAGVTEPQASGPPPGSASALPHPDPTFHGVIGTTAKDSKPDFPKIAYPPPGAPNVLLIMTDDVGFGASSTFGGPIQTPSFDRVAKSGLRYNAFNTTALCSPTRAALITGRNHHSVGFGNITEFATGFPGYTGLMPKSAATIGAMLQMNGYTTVWLGKEHNIADWETSRAGPFDHWPTRQGFDYFYGFIGGDTNQWHPALFENDRPVEPPYDDPTYILDRDLADRAINVITMQHSVDPNRPFFVYYVSGSAHAPHHAPKEWIARYKGQFDQGWDKVRQETLARQKELGVVPPNTELTPRPKEIPAWDSLSDVQKRVFARMMEVYAGALSHADYQIGRVLDAVAQTGQLDNTLVIYIMGDNGASAEGSLQGTTNEVATAANGATESIDYLASMMDKLGSDETYNHYPVGWAHAMDTPFQWTKQVASHFGGTRNATAISWPKRIKDAGGLRSQFSHIIDVVPTILEATGIPEPTVVDGIKQMPIQGVSMMYTFDDPRAPTRHKTQYFEIVANRAIYDDGWIACTTPLRLPWVTFGADPDPMAFKWELYHVDQDFSEAHDLAAQDPQKLKELQDLFMQEAKRYDVLPLDASFADRANPALRPSVTRGRSTFEYHQGEMRIPEASAPDVKNRSWSATARVVVPDHPADGVLATLGGRFGGWGLLVLHEKPVFAYSFSNQDRDRFRVTGADKLKPGPHTIRVDFAYDGGGEGKGGMATLFVDDKRVGQGRIERTIPTRFSLDESFDVGTDTGTPVIEDYRPPFAFGGKLELLTIDLK
ncbi:MAG TPA: arylsulfatase [Polyangiaceae bacterium]|nr:arylsulfatase [Polyangiaceae bacterium]